MDFDNPEEQRDTLDLIWQWILDKRLGSIKKDSENKSLKVNKYNIMYGNSKLATIHTSSTKRKNKFGRLTTVYYIRIRFAGLKSYNDLFDVISSNTLLSIAALLHRHCIPYHFCELDIAIDLLCPFHNVLAECMQYAPNVKYNPLGFIQYFNDAPTSYIEKYSNFTKRKQAIMRAYVYDKAQKEKLTFPVTRFELKLQNRFFINNDFGIESVSKALSKYRIYYFVSTLEKQFAMQDLSNLNLRKNIDMSYYAVYPNLFIIQEFIRQVQEVYLDKNDNIIVPPINLNYSYT